MMERHTAETFIMDRDELQGQRQDQSRFLLCLMRGAGSVLAFYRDGGQPRQSDFKANAWSFQSVTQLMSWHLCLRNAEKKEAAGLGNTRIAFV